MIRGLDLSPYHNQAGFELIARDLDIDYPTKADGTTET
jgi:hypothetical protein